VLTGPTFALGQARKFPIFATLLPYMSESRPRASVTSLQLRGRYNKISGGKILSSRTRRSSSRAVAAGSHDCWSKRDSARGIYRRAA